MGWKAAAVEHAHVMEAIERLCARDGVPTNAAAVAALTGIAAAEVGRIVAELSAMEFLCASAARPGGSLCLGDSPMAAARCARACAAGGAPRVRFLRLLARADQALAESRDLVETVRTDRLARAATRAQDGGTGADEGALAAAGAAGLPAGAAPAGTER